MNLNNRTALDPRWTGWGVRALDAFANCLIAIYDPQSELNGENFSPFAAPRTTAPVELWRGMGQMAVFRQTLNADDVAGSVTQVRSVRFTIPLHAASMPVRKGLIVRVLSCPHDPDAEMYEYTVTSGINSGLAWKRTIEAESDMGVIVSPIVIPDPEPGALAPSPSLAPSLSLAPTGA